MFWQTQKIRYTELVTGKYNGANVARCHPPLPATNRRDAEGWQKEMAERKRGTHKNEKKPP